jgi:hypothetical protein
LIIVNLLQKVLGHLLDALINGDSPNVSKKGNELWKY